MTFRIAVVQPISHKPGKDENNIAEAVRSVERAAARGRPFRLLPGNLSGSLAHAGDVRSDRRDRRRPPQDIACMSCSAPSSRSARRTPPPTISSAWPIPDGRAAKYRRTHPNGPWIYTGGTAWEFQWVPGDDFPVFDTAHGKVGLAMCSEVYMPEVSRALALRGAEIIFMPAGKDKRRLWATWRTLIWARAIENLALVVTTQNLFNHSERGLAMVASPEEILFESTAAGMTVVDVSLERIRQMRASRDEVTSANEYAAKQGVLGPQWQRPELRDADLSASAARGGRVAVNDTTPVAARPVRGRKPLTSAQAAARLCRQSARPRGGAPPRYELSCDAAGERTPPAPTRSPARWWCCSKRGDTLDPLFTPEEARAFGPVREERVPRDARQRRPLRYRHRSEGRRSAEGARRSLRHRPALDRRSRFSGAGTSGADRRSKGDAALACAASLLRELRRADCARLRRLEARVPGLQGRAFPAHRSGRHHAGDRWRPMPARPPDPFVASTYSCLAGFIEPGETVEDAVRRETREEAGITCGRVRYFATQPWPFPMSLMIGCHAEATVNSDYDRPRGTRGRALVHRAEAAAMLMRKHPDGLITPPPMAIAHHIIRAWVETGAAVLG